MFFAGKAGSQMGQRAAAYDDVRFRQQYFRQRCVSYLRRPYLSRCVSAGEILRFASGVFRFALRQARRSQKQSRALHFQSRRGRSRHGRDSAAFRRRRRCGRARAERRHRILPVRKLRPARQRSRLRRTVLDIPPSRGRTPQFAASGQDGHDNRLRSDGIAAADILFVSAQYDGRTHELFGREFREMGEDRRAARIWRVHLHLGRVSASRHYRQAFILLCCGCRQTFYPLRREGYLPLRLRRAVRNGRSGLLRVQPSS